MQCHIRFLSKYFIALLLCLPTQCISAEHALKKPFERQEVSLGVIGYNYTDRDIDSYSVNGVWGGNIRRSSYTSGGGGVACCVNLTSTKPENNIVKVKWQVDGCTYILKNKSSGNSQKIHHLYYKEAIVNVSDLSKGRQNYLETHIFKDGSIKVRLTQDISRPLVRLDENRPDQSFFPRCKDDKKPG